MGHSILHMPIAVQFNPMPTYLKSHPNFSQIALECAYFILNTHCKNIILFFNEFVLLNVIVDISFIASLCYGNEQ